VFSLLSEQNGSLTRLRWALLLVFPAVCIAVALHLGPTPELLISCAVSMLSCVFLLRHLTTFTSRNFSVWLVLCLFFLLYFLRYAYFSFDPTPIAKTHPDNVYALLYDDSAALQRSFMFSTIVFAIFCVTSALLLKQAARKDLCTVSNGLRSEGDGKIARILFLGIPVLMLLLGYVAYKYRIGQMGVSGEPLPFRLKGLIFYARQVVLPLLILTLIYLGGKAKNSWVARAGLLLLLAHGVSDMILRGSQSSLLLCILLAIFLVASGGMKLKRKGILIGSVLLLAAVSLMPVIMKYRILRFTSNENAMTVLGQAITSTGENLSQLLIKGPSVIYYRIPGIETMWAILGVNAKPLGGALIPTLMSPFGITGYLNFTAYQLTPEMNTLFAPGFVGWLYLAGGMIGLVFGALVLAWICVTVPRFIYNTGFRCAPVANTFLLWILFVSVTDGTLDSNLFMIAAGLISLCGVELLLRMSRGKNTAEALG
jgi:hypothetical protein